MQLLKFDNVVYAELDQNVPDINFSTLKTFIDNTEKEHIDLNHNKEEKIYFDRNNRLYPWHRRVLQFQDKNFHDWTNNEIFRNLKNCIDLLPIYKESRIILLLFQEKAKEYDFNFHFDKDDVFGFRICYNLDLTNPFLQLRKLKTNDSIENKQITIDMLGDSSFNILPKKSNTILMLPGNKFAHMVHMINKDVGPRCVFLVRGKIDWTSLKQHNFSQVTVDE